MRMTTNREIIRKIMGICPTKGDYSISFSVGPQAENLAKYEEFIPYYKEDDTLLDKQKVTSNQDSAPTRLAPEQRTKWLGTSIQAPCPLIRHFT